ncbi:NAD dependent epimerase/dehydratase [Apodospora peruviana]|uniref:NAD dependent epimerase/dehydratase n=1 Tax=Apodospora peruviana TaxID=516989 RepID=A0AAE0M7H7_9PEZI|nr:NAD dependent epimerase/dehydratase [Apodospora peruviana]
MSTSVKKLVVCGGNGFLGSRICKAAVSRGWDVTSISRSGEPKWQHVTSSPSPPPWAHKVAWERADIFSPVQYSPLLKGADYVVHSMGILLEADYKGVVSGRESPISGLRKAFSAHSSPNPLEQTITTQTIPPPPPPTSGSQPTYEMMNRDSAILLAKEASAQGVSAFGYISAAGGAPVLPSRYITTKREAEEVIAREFPKMRGVFFRPPFLYDSSRAFTLPLAAATTAGSVFKRFLPGAVAEFMGSAVVKPLQADVVAEAVVEALAEDEVSGPVEVPQLEELAGRGWRKGMV